jgi:hypothetical protein
MSRKTRGIVAVEHERCVCGERLQYTRAYDWALDFPTGSWDWAELQEWMAAVDGITTGRAQAHIWGCYGCGLWTRAGILWAAN